MDISLMTFSAFTQVCMKLMENFGNIKTYNTIHILELLQLFV